MIPKPHSLVATGSFGGLSPPNKVRTIPISGVFIKFSERQAALHTQKLPYWWLSGDGSGPHFVGLSFLPRRREDSETVIWVYLCTQCGFAKTFFPREINVWNSAMIGIFVPNEQISVKKMFCYSLFTTLTQNKKLHHWVIQLKDHQIVESGELKSEQSKKITRVVVGFNFSANFLEFLGLIPTT